MMIPTKIILPPLEASIYPFHNDDKHIYVGAATCGRCPLKDSRFSKSVQNQILLTIERMTERPADLRLLSTDVSPLNRYSYGRLIGIV